MTTRDYDKTVTITIVELPAHEALALAQLVKRIGWTELRQNAVDDDEAHDMAEAVIHLRKALAESGFNPR